MVAEKLHDVKSAAEGLGISAVTVRRLIKKGDIRGIMVGGSLRIADSDLQQYIDRLKENASTGTQKNK